ncbi:MAG: hypothetical protein KUG77_04430 [Nannocystaceae bacterium]|nr:hypothetical protein [Nannocystaceae bacterium]
MDELELEELEELELELDELELDELELDEVDSSITPVVVSSSVVVSSTTPVVVSSSVVELESTRPDVAVLDDASSVVVPPLALILAPPLIPVVRGPEVPSGVPLELPCGADIVALENGVVTTSEPHPSPSTAIQETTRQARRIGTPKPNTIAGFEVL